MKTTGASHIRLLLILFWFAGFPAAAVNWKMVSDDEKIRVEIDVASLARDGNIVKAWERETYRKPEQAKPGDFFFMSAKSLAQHHCTERTTTYLFRGFYAADGGEIKSITPGADLGKVDFLVPGSPEERKLIFACTYSAKISAKPLPAPASAEKTAEPPPLAAKKEEQAPAKPVEKAPQKDVPPAKSADNDNKSPVERKPEKKLESKPEAKPITTTQPPSTPPGKTPAGK